MSLRNSEKGISVTELIISIGIATLIIVSLVSILFTQYGAVLAESTRSNLRTTGQALLTALQDELLFTIEYGHSLHADLADPYEPTGGWDYDTDPDTLIIYEIAIDGARADPERNIVRQRLNDCSTSSVNSNPVAINNIIYFTEDNADDDYQSLVRRTVVPTYDLCSIDRSTGDPCDPTTSTCLGNSKEQSCPVANVGTGNCTKADNYLSANVKDFTVTYYTLDNSVTPFPSAADKIEVNLTLADRVFGRDVEVDINHTIRKVN